MATSDIPDLKTMTALNKLAWGLGGTLTPAEQKKLAEQQYVDRENARIAQEKALPVIPSNGDVRSYTGSVYAPLGSNMQATPIPQGAPKVGEAGGGIDVRSYTGSMYSENATPILGAQRQQYNPNVSADSILGARFGQRPQGQIQYADRPAQAAPVASVAAPIAPQPPPMLRRSAPVAQPEAPVVPSLLGGQVIQPPAPAAYQAPLLGSKAYQPGSQGYQAFQALKPSSGLVEQSYAQSPGMKQIGFEEQDRQLRQLSSDYAAGRIRESDIPPSILGQVKMQGEKMRTDASIAKAQLSALEAKPAQSESYNTLAEATAAINSQKGNFPENTIPTIKREGNRYVVETSVSPQRQYQTPAEKAQEVGLIEQSKNDTDYIKSVEGESLNASDILDQNKEIKRLIESGIPTGFGTEVKTKILSALKGAGINVDSSRLGDREYLQALVATDALNQAKAFYTKQGSVSDSERKRIDTIAMSVGKDPQALLQLMSIRDALAQRAVGANAHIREIKSRRPDATSTEIAESVKNWYAENRLSKFIEQGNAQAKATTTTQPQGAVAANKSSFSPEDQKLFDLYSKPQSTAKAK